MVELLLVIERFYSVIENSCYEFDKATIWKYIFFVMIVHSKIMVVLQFC